MTAPETDLQFAVRVARQAGHIMKAGLGAAAVAKSDGTPVTRMDGEINAFIRGEAAVREQRTLGEEDARHDYTTSGQVWVCDPIDGTWLFAAGVPGSVFSLALVDNGAPILGVVYDPWTDRMIYAAAGGGAFVNGSPILVNGKPEIAGACLVLPGNSVEAFDAARLFTRAIEANADVVTTGSAVHDAVMVPLGFAAGTVYPYTSPWDMAAVAVIVAEAGGRITDLEGEPQRYDGPVKGAVISNGFVHDELVAMIATCRPAPTP